MTITYDNSAVSAEVTGSGSATQSVTLTVASNSTVVVLAETYVPPTSVSATCNGVAMNVASTFSTTSLQCGTIIYLSNVAAGSKTVSVTVGGSYQAVKLVVASYLGASSVVSLAANSGSGTTASISSTMNTTDWLVGFFTSGSAFSSASGSNLRAKASSGGSTYCAAIADATGSTSPVAVATTSGSWYAGGLKLVGQTAWTGSATTNLTANRTANGGAGYKGPANTTSVTASTAAAGVRGAVSGASTTIAATATAQGVRNTSASASTTVVFGSDAGGWSGGNAVTTVSFGSTGVDGVRGRFGDASTTFGFGASAQGGNTAVGMATSTFLDSTTADGFRGRNGGAATTIGFGCAVVGWAGDAGTASTTINFSATVNSSTGGTTSLEVMFGAVHGGQVHHNHHSQGFSLDDYDPWQQFIVADQLAEQRRIADSIATPEFEIDVYSNVYGMVGQICDYISATVTFTRNSVGTATIVLKGDDPIVPYAIQCRDTVVPITITVNGLRWSGRIDVCTDDMVDGVETVTLQCLHDWNWLNKILVWPNFALPIQVQFPKEALYVGPAATVVELMLGEQIIRLQSGLWELVNNILNPPAWFATMMMGKGLLTPCAVIPTNPLTDGSKWVAVSGRMDTCATLIEPICKDNGLLVTADLWLPGEPQPTTLFTLSQPTIVFRVQDKSNVTGPTGTFLDGLLESIIVDPLASMEWLQPFLNPNNEFAPDGVNIAPVLGVNYKLPWPIYDCDNTRSGVKECHINHHHPLAYTVVGGGKSPQWVNKLIDLLLEAAITAILAAISALSAGAAAAVAGIPDTLLDGLFDDVILAFQLVENAGRRQKLGPYGYPEFFTSTGSTAYTIEEFFALEIAMWDTRGYSSAQLVTYDNVPYSIGRDFGIGDQVLFIRRGKLYADYVDQLTVVDDRTNRVRSEIQIGDNSAQESPWAKIQRRLSSFESAMQIALLSSN